MTSEYAKNETRKRIKLQKSQLEYFEIKNLFGDRDVKLKFPSIASIIVSDNGTGKTTVLNSLYSVLSADFTRLARIDFDKITLKVSGHDPIKICRDDVFSERMIEPNDRVMWHLKRLLPKTLLMELVSVARTRSDPFSLRDTRAFEEAVRMSGQNPRYILDLVMRLVDSGEFNPKGAKKMEEVKEFVTTHVNLDVLPLTTYRRVEEDIQAFGNLKEESIGSSLIKFGMSDVDKTFEKITRSIRDTSANSYSVISGQMLTQLIDKIEVSEEMLKLIGNTEQIKIVLGRTGGNLTDSNKAAILEKLTNGSIRQNEYLAYFLSKLTEVYIAQREIDDAIKDFVRRVNGYLVNKKVVYDEVNPKIFIQDLSNGRIISLSNLSSGEKQLVSIMSRLYLEEGEKKLAIIFDEPELSLSTVWQKKLLPDIVESGRCGLLVAATHSPFIFDNGLDHYARDLEIRYKAVANG